MRAFRLDEIPESRRDASPDGTRILGWFVSERSEDRYEASLTWEIVVFDARSRLPIAGFTRGQTFHRDTSETEGRRVAGASFDRSNPEYVKIRYEDGSRERARIRLCGDIPRTRTPGVEDDRVVLLC